MLTFSLLSNSTTDAVIDMVRHYGPYRGQPLIVRIGDNEPVQFIWNGERLRLPAKEEGYLFKATA